MVEREPFMRWGSRNRGHAHVVAVAGGCGVVVSAGLENRPLAIRSVLVAFGQVVAGRQDPDIVESFPGTI